MKDLKGTLESLDGLELLIACVMGEAEAEPLLGKIAVACVVRNRVNDHRWPNSYKEVLLQRSQFSCFLPKYFRPVILKHRFKDIYWRECKYAAWGVYFNWVMDVTNGANHYHSVDMEEPPYWAKGEHPVLRLGSAWFYKL